MIDIPIENRSSSSSFLHSRISDVHTKIHWRQTHPFPSTRFGGVLHCAQVPVDANLSCIVLRAMRVSRLLARSCRVPHEHLLIKCDTIGNERSFSNNLLLCEHDEQQQQQQQQQQQTLTRSLREPSAHLTWHRRLLIFAQRKKKERTSKLFFDSSARNNLPSFWVSCCVN